MISGQGSKSAQASKTTPNKPPAQKPAAYRPPHAKNAASIQAEVYMSYIWFLYPELFCLLEPKARPSLISLAFRVRPNICAQT